MVNGKSFETFTEIQSKALKTWIVHFDDETYRVVLEKGNLDIWANGHKLDVAVSKIFIFNNEIFFYLTFLFGDITLVCSIIILIRVSLLKMEQKLILLWVNGRLV